MVYNTDMKIETIEINGNVWKKFKGDEGQDVYVAEFIKKDESVLGNFPDESFYDILVDSDADFYLPSNDIGICIAKRQNETLMNRDDLSKNQSSSIQI